MASISKRGDTYKITVSSGRDVLGRQIRHYKTWKPDPGMTERQTEKALKKAVYEFEESLSKGFRPDDRQTFSEYAEYYFKLQEQRGIKPQSIHSARRRSKRVCEYIGHMRLGDIRPSHLNSMYLDLSKKGARAVNAFAYPIEGIKEIIEAKGIGRDVAEGCGIGIMTLNRIKRGERCTENTAKKIEQYLDKKNLFRIEKRDEPLRTNTVLALHAFVCSVLAQAEKEMIITYNPATRADVPRLNNVKKNKCMQPEDLKRFMNALQNEPIRERTLFTLFALTGCRRGEIMALKWSKIDLFNRSITIDASLNYVPGYGTFEGTTKTDNVRKISISPDVVRLLISYKIWHDGEREKWGDQWKGSEYIFTNERGGTPNANEVNYILNAICQKYNLPHITPHMFRHTAASILISKGIDILTVSKMLGHAKTTTTLDIYGHEIEEAKKRAVDCLTDEILEKTTLQKDKNVV